MPKPNTSANRAVRPSSLLWALPPLAGLALLVVWCLRGLVEAPVALAGVTFVALALTTLACSIRRGISSLLAAALPHGAAIRDALALVVSSVLGAAALELPWNHAITSMEPRFALLEIALVALALTAAYFLTVRRGALSAFVSLACLLVGLAQHFVIAFKGDCILPADVLAARTAAAVAGQFRYVLDAGCLAAICCCAIAWALLSTICRDAHQPRQGLQGLGARTASGRPRPEALRATVASMVTGLVLAGGCAWLATGVDYAEAFGADLHYWYQLDYYQRQGFAPTFAYAVQDLKVKAPAGYSESSAHTARERLAQAWRSNEGASEERQEAEEQFVEALPNIVVVMNETFADLSVIDGLGCGYSGPSFFKNGLDAIMRGAIAVPAYGGGTANTEYELLTGNSLAFLGAGKNPYEMFDLNTSSSLARQLSQLGYATRAIHPNAATNWNRNSAYPALGFDYFDDISAFEGAPTYHNGVTDKATYEHVLDILNGQDAPQFVFDVTMQNHSGYLTGNIDPADLPGLDVPIDDETTRAELDEYLACIAASDRDLEWFVGELEKLEEPTVLVFFGDHHPGFSRDLNDALTTDAGTAEHGQRVRQTVYAIWANYYVGGAWRKGLDAIEAPTSSSALAANVLELIGAPLSDYQMAQLGARRSVVSIDSDGYLDPDGSWHALEDGEEPADLADLHQAAYLNYTRGE